MPRVKSGGGGFGKTSQSNRSKNSAVKAHKNLVMQNAHNHKKLQTGLKRQYHAKGGISIGNFGEAKS